MSVTVYWDSWASPYVEDPAKSDLASLYSGIDCICLAFATPTTTYKKGSMSTKGTGLDFSSSFYVVKQSIALAKQKGTKVLLSVGGSTFPFNLSSPYANFQNLIDLSDDLGCDGIDIDWEPPNGGASVDYAFGWIIKGFKDAGVKYLTAACTGNGALDTTDVINDGYRGMNKKGLLLQGKLLDEVNVMAYDSGKFDAVASYNQFRAIYQGKINLGFELGEQSWGGYLTTEEDVRVGCHGVLADRAKGNRGGIFIWDYHKDTTGSPGVQRTIDIARSILSVPTVATASHVACPNCKVSLSLSFP